MERDTRKPRAKMLPMKAKNTDKMGRIITLIKNLNT